MTFFASVFLWSRSTHKRSCRSKTDFQQLPQLSVLCGHLRNILLHILPYEDSARVDSLLWFRCFALTWRCHWLFSNCADLLKRVVFSLFERDFDKTLWHPCSRRATIVMRRRPAGALSSLIFHYASPFMHSVCSIDSNAYRKQRIKPLNWIRMTPHRLTLNSERMNVAYQEVNKQYVSIHE